MDRRNATPFALGALALGLALGLALAAAPAARADGSEGMGTQALAEAARRDAARGGAPGWRNGMPTLVHAGSGGGYSVVYSGAPDGDASMGGATLAGNADGNPVVEYRRAAPRPTATARR